MVLYEHACQNDYTLGCNATHIVDSVTMVMTDTAMLKAEKESGADCGQTAMRSTLNSVFMVVHV